MWGIPASATGSGGVGSLQIIKPPANGCTVEYLRAVVGSAKIFIRLLQQDLDLSVENEVIVMQHVLLVKDELVYRPLSTIQGLYFIVFLSKSVLTLVLICLSDKQVSKGRCRYQRIVGKGWLVLSTSTSQLLGGALLLESVV